MLAKYLSTHLISLRSVLPLEGVESWYGDKILPCPCAAGNTEMMGHNRVKERRHWLEGDGCKSC